MKQSITLVLACALVVACGPSGPVANGAENTTSLPPPDEAVPDPSASAPANATTSNLAAASLPQATTRIPALFHGRWGMTPGDCTSTRGDNKGLVTIDGDQLRFYESRALPGNDVAADANSIRGTFNFTGEGQEWTRFVALRAEGDKLTRTESNPVASYNYVKCV